MPYTSTRYLPIRDAVFDLLRADAVLSSEIKGWAKEMNRFESFASTQLPAAAVVFAAPANRTGSERVGEEQAGWASSARDHTYLFHVILAAESLDAQAAEDSCFTYLERAEDVLRSDPTLFGMVRTIFSRIVRRDVQQRERVWRAQVVMEVRAEKSIVCPA
jgi:hypothetical protein